jgi:phosphatidylglycerol:prolipoprotein diacylglycerol transferase
MLPYIRVLPLRVGPFSFHLFGLLVATAIVFGWWIGFKRAARLGLDLGKLRSFTLSLLITGFLVAHLVEQIFYHPDEVARRPWTLLIPWEGISSFGGFVGAVIGGFGWKFFTWERGFFRLRKQPEKVLGLTELMLQVFPIAWIFGRMGCAIAHDHPGHRVPHGTFLSVAYPGFEGEGKIQRLGPIDVIWGSAPRFDLGLLELLFTMVLSACILLTWSRRLKPGTYTAVVCLSYAPVRFVMDFYRDSEELRHGGLTFAQWAIVALFLFGIGMAAYVVRSREA